MLSLSVRADKDNELKDFEDRAYELRMDLVHNHTFDTANIAIADSLYRESVDRGSVSGKLYALQIKYYAVANVGNDSIFYSTIDEYIAIAKEMNYFEEYFDATSTKIQYEMRLGEYSRGMFMANDMLKMAEKEHSNLGLYESNLLLGQIFKYRSSFNAAKRYFNTALKYVEHDDSIPHFTLYREIAECYGGSMRYDKALEYANLAKQWANFDIYRLYGEWTYLDELFRAKDMNAFRAALVESMLNDEEHYKSLPSDMQITLDAMKLAAQGRFDAARTKAMEHGSEGRQLSLLILLAQYEGKLGDAFQYQNRLSLVTDSIESELLDSELAELDVRLGKANAEYQAEQASRRHLLMTSIIIGVFLVIIIIGLILWNRNRRLQNKQLKMARDVTEQKNKELTIAQAATVKALEEAENANAMRLHFIQNMSHEIRTPLNVIYGFAQLLTDPSMDLDAESEMEMRMAITDSTHKLTRMVDDIITLSNYDSHSVKINKIDTDSRCIIEEVAARASAEIPDSVTLNPVLSNSLPISTDAEKLISALTQVVGNALKFTDSGSVTLGANDTERPGCITFYVEDTGKGIPAELSERIFDRFYKVDEYIPGTGLGLSLCRVIMESLDGEVFLDTTYTRGARFVLHVPA